jgi:Flp pilus assembly protein TadD
MTDPTHSPADDRAALDALATEGLDHFANGDFAQCIAVLERALAIDPNDVAALRTIAMAQFRIGDFVRALEFGERHVKAAPKDVMAMSSLSLFLMKNGRVKDAEDASAKAKVMTWRKQLKDGPQQDTPGLTIVEKPQVVESPPIMPLMPPPPPRPQMPS